MNKKNVITLKNENGEEMDCRVLFTIEDDKKGKNYIVYTDGEEDKDGRLQTYASIYKTDEDGNMIELTPVKTQKEWDFISKILESLQESEKNNEKEV